MRGWFAGVRDGDSSIEKILEVMESFFGGIQATVSDIGAGIVLVGIAQKNARFGIPAPSFSDLHMEGFPWGPADQNALDRSCGGSLPHTELMTDRNMVADLLHNLCFATGVYGWMVHAYSGRSSLFHRGRRLKYCCARRSYFGACCTCCFRSLCCSPNDEESTIHALNKRAALATLREWPGHEASKLVFLSQNNAVNVTAYAVFADPKFKRIVIAVRGTLSAADVLTDACAVPVEVDDPKVTGPGPGPHFVHSGMWDAAQHVYKDLSDRQILARLLGDVFGPFSRRDDIVELPDCRDYSVMVVGHSLGAGTSQVLTALLQQSHPRVQCRCYGSPSVFSEAWALHLGERVACVVLGDDIIGRMSVRNMEMLRDRMLALAAHCPHHKHKLFWHGAFADWSRPIAKLVDPKPVSVQAGKSLEGQGRKKASPRFYHADDGCAVARA